MKARKPASGWSAPLSRPLTLHDGTRLETLADAPAFVLALPPGDQERNAWQRAAARLIDAAEHGGDIEAATHQVFAALFVQAMVQLE